jgi:hypothetical protein
MRVLTSISKKDQETCICQAGCLTSWLCNVYNTYKCRRLGVWGTGLHRQNLMQVDLGRWWWWQLGGDVHCTVICAGYNIIYFQVKIWKSP